ncbi:MAG: glycosyltransferase [Treponema sp.]|nr:glycosyltransferase [Treponema sp.]MEE3435016.1 glycosyltransferase [Treponema sp.]
MNCAKKKIVYIYPTNNSSNKYSALQEEAVRRAGYQLAFSFKQFFKIDAFILNWFETLGKGYRLEYLKKILKLFLFRVFRKKVFWVVHNRAPHQSKNGRSKVDEYSRRLMKALLKRSYKIIVLCDETSSVLQDLSGRMDLYESKIVKIPHPNYIGAYEESKSTAACPSINNRKVKFLFIGAVKPYKNIDLLVDCFNQLDGKNAQLLICGKCYDSNYEAELKSKITNPNIRCDFRFVPDQDLVQLICQNDILILPYSMASSLNSGTIILAFSNHKTVISPLIGTLKEYKDKNFFYSYEYDSQEDHKACLLKQINTVLADVKKNPDCLAQKGKIVYDEVLKNNSLQTVSDLYKQILDW